MYHERTWFIWEVWESWSIWAIVDISTAHAKLRIGLKIKIHMQLSFLCCMRCFRKYNGQTWWCCKAEFYERRNIAFWSQISCIFIFFVDVKIIASTHYLFEVWHVKQYSQNTMINNVYYFCQSRNKPLLGKHWYSIRLTHWGRKTHLYVN